MPNKYIPLAERSAIQLRTQAEQYRGMAATATSAEVRIRLLRLAIRFDGLADQREAETEESAPQSR